MAIAARKEPPEDVSAARGGLDDDVANRVPKRVPNTATLACANCTELH